MESNHSLCQIVFHFRQHGTKWKEEKNNPFVTFSFIASKGALYLKTLLQLLNEVTDCETFPDCQTGASLTFLKRFQNNTLSQMWNLSSLLCTGTSSSLQVSLVLVHDLVRMMRNWRLGMQSSLKDIVVKMMVLVHDLVCKFLGLKSRNHQHFCFQNVCGNECNHV